MRRRTVIIIISVLAIVILGGGTGAYILISQANVPLTGAASDQSTDRNRPGDGAEPTSDQANPTARQLSLAQHTAIYQVQAASARQEVEISGNVQPRESRNYSFSLAGSLESLEVREQQWIDQGDLIARLDNSELSYQIAELEYQIEQEAIFGTPRKLALLRSQLALLEEKRTNYRLYAGFSGLVVEVPVESGDTVEKGGTIARIITRHDLMATVSVDELDVPRIKPGQEVRVYFDALEDTPVYGAVLEIAQEGTVTGNGYTVVDVDIRLDQVPESILPGFSFSGSVFVSAEEQALIVDKRAVQSLTEDRGILYQVVSQDPLRVSPLPVEIQEHSLLEYQISGEVQDGLQVVSAAAAEEVMSQQTSAQNGFSLPGLRLPGSGQGSRGGDPSRFAPPADGPAPPSGSSGPTGPSGTRN